MAVSKVNVVRLILQETGTYNIQYYRPYSINVTPQSVNQLIKRVEHSMYTNGNLTASAISGMGEELVAPQASPQAPVAIPQGWTNKRLRFVLEIAITNSLGVQSIYYVQGYTNHFGVSSGGHIDPNMLFYINSVFQLSRTLRNTPTGAQYSDRIVDCSHLLVAPNVLDPAANYSLFTIQPVDLFSYMQINVQNSGMNAYDGYGDMAGMAGGDTIVLDTRLMSSTDFFKSSQRKNNAPLEYLTSTINNGVMGLSINDATEGFISAHHNAISQSRGFAEADENSMKNSEFISLLNQKNYQTANQISSIFTLSQLANIDPNLPAVTNYLHLSPEHQAQLHQTGLTAHWTGSDKTTQIAVILANAVPTIMSQCLISQIHVRSTNCMLAGQITTQILNAKSLSNSVLVNMFEVFKQRLEKEIIFDFTIGNQIPYELDLRSDMFGETTISLKLDQDPEVVYVVPSFCDSLISPIANVDPNRIQKEAMSAELLIDSVFSACNSGNQQQTGIRVNYGV